MWRHSYLLAALIFLQGALLSQESVIKEAEFEVRSDALIELSNKYGDIYFESWDELRTEVKVEIKVEGSDEDAVEYLLDKLEVYIKGNEEKVEVKTNLDELVQWNNVSDNKRERVRMKLRDGRNIRLEAFSIIYQIKAPKSNHLKLDHKYGDVFLTEIEGNTDIWLKYGNLNAGALNGDNYLNLGYVGGKIASLTKAEMEAKYSELSIVEVGTLKLQSKYSTLKFEAIDTLLSESRYNNLRARSVRFLGLIERHTDFKADSLLALGNIRMEYGSCRINHLDHRFEHLAIEGEYTDFYIQTDEDASFRIALSSKYGGLTYPSSLEIDKISESNSSKEVEGRMGPRPESRISIEAKYGNIILK